MTRLLGLLLALVLLPVFVSPAASAACSPYFGCARTRTQLTVPNPVPQGTRPLISVKVSVWSGNAKPAGRVKVVVKRVGGGYSWTKTVFVSHNRRKSVRPERLDKRGKYRVTARFIPQPDSVWGASSDLTTFRVERKP